jgi:short-subunit dehydrogenase
VAGSYQKMRADDFDLTVAKQMVALNINGVLNCLAAILPTLLVQGRGGIGIVSSIAGLSGLPQALIYGPTKAALINLCESLYLDLHKRGIGVYLINPGFVATPLTAKNDFSMPALISAEQAALQIVSGIERGEFHIHFPKRFTNFLRLFKLLPYRAYFYLIHKATGL